MMDRTAPHESSAKQAARWRAIVTRDPTADGTFYYSVGTTGVYCRPSCGARPASRQNVRFHRTPEAAERAGFRPCKRCRPDAWASSRRLDQMKIAYGSADSLGLVLVAETAAGIAAVMLGDDRAALRRDLEHRFPGTVLVDGGRATRTLVASVAKAVASPSGAALAGARLDLRGTPFQRLVWTALRDIPAGSTASYADIARRIGRPAAVRAVAQACAANPIAVLIPCHRVVRRDGDPSGYRWGTDRKRSLLEREAGG